MIEKWGTPRAVLLSIRDYVRLAAPEPEVLKLIGEESKVKGTDSLTRSKSLSSFEPHARRNQNTDYSLTAGGASLFRRPSSPTDCNAPCSFLRSPNPRGSTFQARFSRNIGRYWRAPRCCA